MSSVTPCIVFSTKRAACFIFSGILRSRIRAKSIYSAALTIGPLENLNRFDCEYEVLRHLIRGANAAGEK